MFDSNEVAEAKSNLWLMLLLLLFLKGQSISVVKSALMATNIMTGYSIPKEIKAEILLEEANNDAKPQKLYDPALYPVYPVCEDVDLG